jgi:hypothetical protein
MRSVLLYYTILYYTILYYTIWYIFKPVCEDGLIISKDFKPP